LPVERVRVGRVEQPLHVRVRAVVDHLPDELLPQSAPAVLREHVDVREVGDGEPVAERAAEADLAVAVVEPDDTRGLAHEALLRLPRSAGRPIRLLGQEAMHLADVDAGHIVVELDAVAERALHAESVRSRKPPCSSYEAVTTASASRRARSESGEPTAAARGVESRVSIAASPSAERCNAS